jgi:hypothetical protein
VELTRGTSDKQLAAQLELLKTWLQRSGNCPFSLSLTHARNITQLRTGSSPSFFVL